VKLFLSGLLRFNKESLQDLKLFVKTNKIEKIYSAFWISDLDSQKNLSIQKAVGLRMEPI
tara:strand:- start:249 stop:428 length:180 start_codon:yes stop_codon:yes gene_type:complete